MILFNYLIKYFRLENQKFETDRKKDSRSKSTYTLHVHCLPFLTTSLSLSLCLFLFIFKFMFCQSDGEQYFFLNQAQGTQVPLLASVAAFDFKYSNMDIWC